MKIEMCEQLVASWLKHIKGCQVVETNWRLSPISTNLDGKAIDRVIKFMDEVKQIVKDDGLDIFKKTKEKQFVMQCEIDVVGVKIADAKVDELYLVDSAFHENGLGYKDAVANVLKKLLRAVVVADLVFEKIAPQVIFVAPKCGTALKKKIETAVVKLDCVVKKYYPTSKLSLIFNEDFYSQIYIQVVEQIDNISDDNDLFLRSIKISKIAESFAPKPIKSTKSKKATSAPIAPSSTPSAVAASGLKIGQYAKYVFTKLLTTGQLSPAQISDLSDKKYCSKTFKLSYAVLADYSSSADLKFYYKDGRVLGLYLVCREWKDVSRTYIDAWLLANGFTI